MSQAQQERAGTLTLQDLLDRAVRKIGGGKENDICRYIPSDAGGYMHHFTMRKMKTESPFELAEMIEKYILTVPQPQKVAPKARAARGSRKRRDQFYLSRNDLEKLLTLARNSGDREMERKLMPPRKELRHIKRELIACIKHNKIDQDLWNSYVEVANATAAARSEVSSEG